MVKARVIEGEDQTIIVGTAAEDPFRVALTDDDDKPIVGRPYKFVTRAGDGKKDLASDLTSERGEASMRFTPDAVGSYKVFLFVEEGGRTPSAIFTGRAVIEDDVNADAAEPEQPAQKPRTNPPPLPLEAAGGPATAFFAAGDKMLEQALEPGEPVAVTPFPVTFPPAPRKFTVSYNMLLALIAAGILAAVAAALLT